MNADDEDQIEDIEEEICFTVPEKMVGYVIGKNGQTKNRIMEQTNTYIKTKRPEEDETYFIVQGRRENAHSAKLIIKKTVNNGMLKNLGLESLRFPFVDSDSGEFELKFVEKKSDRPTEKRFCELLLRSSEDIAGNTDYSFLADQISQILQKNNETNRGSRIWCHFGHIYLTNIQPDEEGNVFDLQDLNNHLRPRRFYPPDHDIPDVTKWRYNFFGYIRNQDEKTFFSQLERWLSSQSERSPYLAFHRYEFTYLTPSCREIRIKVFLEVKQRDSDPSKVAFENAPSPLDVKNVLKYSDTYPYFYICESTARRAVVDILEPSGPDIRLITEANLTSVPEDKELLEEVDILYTYVINNLVITEDGKVNLLQRNVPEDFDLHYSRMSERKIYTVTSEDDEKFNVIVCYESPRDIKKGDYDETKNSVDIHLFYHEWENKFKTTTWDPQEIVDKIPRFMACARSLARALIVDNTTPPAILARGPKALRAYQMALKSGKTKNLRVPVMLVGQSRAGKTSLLRSLKSEMFDPKEDSTEGVTLHRSISKAEENVWIEDETTENSFYDCAAKAMAENLTAPPIGQEQSTQEEDDDILSLPTNEESLHQNIPTVEKRKSGDFSDVTEDQNRESPLQSGFIKPKSQEKQETAPENFPENSPENPFPEEIIEKTTHMLQNLKTLENDERLHYITMDFAGQPVYQATHPVFLSLKGIYILVHSLKNDAHHLATPIVKRGSLGMRKTDDNCPMTNMDHLEFWLSFVASNATTVDDKMQLESSRLPRKFPPVFLVCTHADEPFENQDSKEVSQRILAHLKRDENPSGQHLVHDIYPVDNTVSGSSDKEENEYVKKLREDIQEAAENLPQTGEDIPIRWLKFEKELEEIEQKKYINLEEAKGIALKCQVDLESDELDTLLGYLHDLKVIIYFEDTNMIIIDTQWLLDMFVKVITVQPYLEWQRRFQSCWRKLEDEGVLERELVEHLWNEVADEQNTIDILLAVMEKFSLLCRWKQSDGSEVFFVPALLVNSAVKSWNEIMTDQQLPIPLLIRFTRTHLPLGIFPRMLVAIAEFCNEKWPESRLPKGFHNFCRFYDVGGKNGPLDLFVTSDMRSITVGVIPGAYIDVSHNWDLIVDFCQVIKEFIYKTLEGMRKDSPWIRNMNFEFGIRCPICRSSTTPCSHKANACMRDTCTHFVPEKDLPRCYNDPTNRTTFIDEKSYCHWFPKTTEYQNEPAEEINLTNSISVPDAASCKDLGICFGDKSIATIASDEAASKVADLLKLDKLSSVDPPDDLVVKCRELCSCLKSNSRDDIVKKIRDVLPSGMTGPLRDGSMLVKCIDYNVKQRISRALSGKDEWKSFAENVGVSKHDIGFYDRRKSNPVLVILEEHCGDMTVEELYVHIVKSGNNAIADEFL